MKFLTTYTLLFQKTTQIDHKYKTILQIYIIMLNNLSIRIEVLLLGLILKLSKLAVVQKNTYCDREYKGNYN